MQSMWSVCLGGRLHHEESFFPSEVSTVWLLASRKWRNAETYVLTCPSFISFSQWLDHKRISVTCCLCFVFSYYCCCVFTAGSRPPLILQSPPPYAASPREGHDQKQQLQQRKKTLSVKEEKDMYDIVSSNKDSTKLTLKLSRVKSNESDTPGNNDNNNNQHESKSCIVLVNIIAFHP